MRTNMHTNPNSLRTNAVAWLAALFVWAPLAMAAQDSAMVNYLSGDVSYSGGAGAAKAKLFMKVREGDRFTVPNGAQFGLVYFEGGRKETYTGPNVLVAGAKQSTVQSGAPAQVTSISTGATEKIAKTPELVQMAKLGRSGGVTVRGVERAPKLTAAQDADLRKAREDYRRMRAEAAADDITPELILYSTLHEFLLYAELKPVVDEMAKRQPGNPDVATLVEYVKARTTR